MSKLPKQYQWLEKEPGPKMIVEALKLYGTLETPGKADNPVIMSWAKALKLTAVYSHDSVPWCGLFMGYVALRAGKPIAQAPLWALSWADEGTRVKVAMLGDILTFKRSGGGHVGLYVGEDATAYHVLGGNQSDKVCIARIAKSRLYQIRRPKYINQPKNIRVIKLKATGSLSTNER